MLPFRYVAIFALLALASAQDFEYQAARPAPARIQPGFSGPAQAKPTPIAILKQINRHNEDGSYTYGYEGADGSFKIETKLPTGEVKGKYGYVDDTGKVRVVEYGATKYGFEPSGEGITVAPPTLVDETTNKDGLQIQEDFSQYEPQPARARAPAPRPRPSPSFETSFEPAQQYNPAPQQFAPAPRPAPRPAPARSFAPAPRQPSFGFAGAAPAPIQEDTYEEPAPRPLPKITYAQPRPQPQQQQFSFGAPASTQAIARPQPQYQPQQQQQQQFAPQPQFQPQQQQQQFAPRPAASRPAQPSRSGGVLDQLAKDYALPQGGAAPLHDISFGYY